MSLKDKTIKGVKWTTFGSLFNAVLQIVQLAILARILSPSDFGLMAIVMVIIGFSNMFIDMGISNAIIYKQKVTENQLTSLYWLNVFVGLLLFLIILIISPFVAQFYDSPQLTKLTIIVGTTFLIQPFGQQFMILLQKELQFDKITKVQISARFCSFLATVLFAIFNFGVLSLAYGIIIYAIISTYLFIYNGVKIYQPKFYFRKKDLSEFLSFGLYQLAEKSLNYFSSQLDTILIGKFLGIEILGVYNIAKNLVSKPSAIVNPVITKVTFPVMSKVSDNILALKKIYEKTVKYITLVNVPIYSIIFICSKPLVLIAFGDKYLGASILIKLLSLSFIFKSFASPVGSLLLSKGKANSTFFWSLINLIIYPISIFLAFPYGINYILYAFLTIQLILFLPYWKFIVNKNLKTSLKTYCALLFVPVFYSLISAMPILIFNSTDINIFYKFTIGTFSYAIIYFIIIYKYENDILQILKLKGYDKES